MGDCSLRQELFTICEFSLPAQWFFLLLLFLVHFGTCCYLLVVFGAFDIFVPFAIFDLLGSFLFCWVFLGRGRGRAATYACKERHPYKNKLASLAAMLVRNSVSPTEVWSS